MEKRGMYTKKRLIIFFVAVIVFIGGIIMYFSSDAHRLRKQLELGQKYLEELDYEQAAIAFEKAIAIDEKSVEAYLGLAGAYMALENADKAEQVLAQGAESTDDARILEVLEKMKDTEEAKQQPELETENNAESDQDNSEEDAFSETDAATAMYQQYYDKLMELQDQYGVCEDITEEVEDDPWMENNRYLKGLCFAKLIDFNADGTEEMLLAYNAGKDPDSLFAQNYVVEVWAWQGTAIGRVYAGDADRVEDGAGIYVDLHEGNYYLYNYIEEYDEETSTSRLVDEWRGYENETFDIIKRNIETNVYSEDGDVKTFKINETEVSETELIEDGNQWREVNDYYGLQNGGFTLDTSVDELVSAFQTLSNKLGTDWVDNIERERGNYSNSVWGTSLIGKWENLYGESSFEYATVTFYENGLAEMHRQNAAYFGSFEIGTDGDVTLHIDYGYFYNNAEAMWLDGTVSHQILLTRGKNIYEMKCTYLGGDDELFLPDNLILNHITDENADYSSADESIQYYEGLVSDE